MDDSPVSAKKRVTLSDIGRELGLSKRAVSQALRDRAGNTRVSPATKERVLALAAQMGYRQNMAARALFTGKSGVFGILGFQSYMHSAQLRVTTALGEFAQHSLVPIVVHAWGEDPELRNAHLLIDARVNGVLLIGGGPLAERYAEEITSYGIPVVGIASHDFRSVPTFGARRRQGFRLLTEHLIGNGLRRLTAMVRTFPGCDATSAPTQSLAGINDALKIASSKGIATDFRVLDMASVLPNEAELSLVPDVHELHADGYLGMWHLIESGEPLPEGILCIADGYAIGLLRACAEAGLRVPDDIAITGYGNDPAATASTTPLTTVEEPDVQLCSLAIRCLIDSCEQSESQEVSSTVLPGRLIVRRSSSRDWGNLPKDLFALATATRAPAKGLQKQA